MSKIDYQALREKAEKATKGSYIVGHTSVNQHGNLTGVFVCQKWKGEPGGVIAECHVNCLVETDVQAYANAEFIAAFNPNVALALLDERERNQQYIKRRDQENEEIALTVGKLRVELGAAENNLIDSECHVAELEEALRDKQALLEASEKRIAELEAELVSQTYKLPHTQFEQIANLYEMQFDDGRTCAFHTDAQKAEQWLQACDGNRVQEYVKLERLQNALSGNSPVTPDGWISCSERMPDTKTAVLVAVEFDRKGDWRMKWATYIPGHPDANDGWIIPGASWKPSHWMPLPEPPQEVN
ncbi:ead/Ea22-like family protein [Escherichia coli]|uniref:ead/Ea22-like family protein n=5 Tax=Escherichia coli TaxID=562 RepID=UPI00039107E3|nr:ead/Ea22-like family protein [Escherichia coli]EHU8783668.1 ead/Ea22-like family protein [Escherichia coli]ERD95724.1 ead/Ea22-like family protein [Escherichia coli B86]